MNSTQNSECLDEREIRELVKICISREETKECWRITLKLCFYRIVRCTFKLK